MKSKYITTIILEGANGVGKSEAIMQLFKLYNYRYMVYHRGEISNLLYARKYNRPFSQTQCGLPFLHILLICSKDELAQRIMKRGGETDDDVQIELNKIDEQDEFINLAYDMMKDYHILICDTSGLSIEEVGLKLKKMIDTYTESLLIDDKVSEWNEMYMKGCNKLHIDFKVRDNQLYFNNVLTMSEYTLQNGVYETYTDKTYPDNLIFMQGYSDEIELKEKDLDFAYIINSKIKKRPEVYDYYDVWNEAGLKFLTSEFIEIPEYKGRIKMERAFGDNFIKELSRAKATIYCSRDLASRKLQTARLYEGIRAKQIVFVDKETDKDNEMLKQIYIDRPDLIKLLSVTPETIINNYNYIINNQLTDVILDYQDKFYNKLTEKLYAHYNIKR